MGRRVWIAGSSAVEISQSLGTFLFTPPKSPRRKGEADNLGGDGGIQHTVHHAQPGPQYRHNRDGLRLNRHGFVLEAQRSLVLYPHTQHIKSALGLVLLDLPLRLLFLCLFSPLLFVYYKITGTRQANLGSRHGGHSGSQRLAAHNQRNLMNQSLDLLRAHATGAQLAEFGDEAWVS